MKKILYSCSILFLLSLNAAEGLEEGLNALSLQSTQEEELTPEQQEARRIQVENASKQKRAQEKGVGKASSRKHARAKLRARNPYSRENNPRSTSGDQTASRISKNSTTL